MHLFFIIEYCWGLSLFLACNECGAEVEFEPHLRTGKCFYCGSPQVVDRPPQANRPNPHFAIGFTVTPERALSIAQARVARAWLAPESFRKMKLEDIRGVYLPAYLYTATARAQYQAKIGENYTVTETYTTTSNGRTVTRTRTRTKTEWRSLAGRFDTYLDDQIVTASKGIPNEELEAVEPFDTSALKRYSPAIISGWVTEEPSVDIHTCRSYAHEEAEEQLSERIKSYLPGDSSRLENVQSHFNNEDMTLTLVPLWVLPIRYDESKSVLRLLVNGQTGKVACKTPTSWLKFTILAIVLLAIAYGIYLGAHHVG